MQTTTRAPRAQLRRAQRRRAAERERAERARRVLARDTQLILDGLRQTRTVSEIHIELTRPIVGAEFALEKARRLERTLQRLAARSLLSTPTTRGYLAEAAALRVSLERQQPPHPHRAIDWTTERLAQTVIDQALVATQPRKGELMNTTIREGGERTLRGLPVALLDRASIPSLAQPAPPAIQVAMPDGSTLEIPGVRWPQPDIWTASERRALLGERPPVEVRRLTRKEANLLSADWHPLGAETRPFGYHAFALFVEREPLALATAGSTHSATVDGSLGLRRENCIELTRLCRSPTEQAAGSARVMLRIWRDFLALPYWPYFEHVEKVALVSYSMPGKAGHLYRHDGWQRVRACKGSGGGGTWSARSRAGRRGPEALWVYWLSGEQARGDALSVAVAKPGSAMLAGATATDRRAA